MAPKAQKAEVVSDARVPPGTAVLASQGAPPVVVTNIATEKAPVVDYVCGLRKVGPRQYQLVTGLVVDGEPNLKVDDVAQPLEHAAESLRIAFQKMFLNIP